MNIVLMGPYEREKIAKVIELAHERPVNMIGIMLRLTMPQLKAAHMAQMTEQTIDIPAGFQATFSFETGHEIGTCRHLSVSRHDGRLPVPDAVWHIAKEYGFVGENIESVDALWLEDLKGHESQAVNLVQRVFQ